MEVVVSSTAQQQWQCLMACGVLLLVAAAETEHATVEFPCAMTAVGFFSTAHLFAPEALQVVAVADAEALDSDVLTAQRPCEHISLRARRQLSKQGQLINANGQWYPCTSANGSRLQNVSWGACSLYITRHAL